ncbi:hypothetical protein OMAG_002746 [Candidatus Omnitrophus magneticus]|uniref:Uncharacterized protein n=1 Tax=Candidatus Omnitrophus magneticus TaxID=1609969 RepID=A0A0F0CPD8_9BACT|nr:hypothetical protein OMAG_002746 [Candidatus Omnitrophus magneticus]
MIMGLQAMLRDQVDPDPEAYDPGIFETYWELCVKALIAEFESLIYMSF